jgi:hypothetical protein
VILATNQYACHRCDGTLTFTLILGVILFVLFVLMLAGYIFLVRKLPNMRLWVSTSAIVIYHSTIVSMLGRLALAWPPSVDTFTQTFTVDFVGFNLVRPECFIVSLGVDAFFAYTILRLSILLILLLGTSFLTTLMRVGKQCKCYRSNAFSSADAERARPVTVAVDERGRQVVDMAGPRAKAKHGRAQASQRRLHVRWLSRPAAPGNHLIVKVSSFASKDADLEYELQGGAIFSLNYLYAKRTAIPTASPDGDEREDYMVTVHEQDRVSKMLPVTSVVPVKWLTRPKEPGEFTVVSVAGSRATGGAVKIVRSDMEAVFENPRLEARGFNQKIDTIEFGQSIIFSVQLSASWIMIYQLIENYDTGGTIGAVGAALASLLLAAELFFVIKWGIMVRSIMTDGSGSAFGLTPKRLRKRLEFIVERYAPKREYWQFVVWGRQFLLTVIALTPEIVTRRRIAMNSQEERDVAAVDEGEELGALETYDNDEIAMAVVYGHAAAAAVLLTGYAALVIKHKPFAFAFQNQLELFLLFCDVLVLSLGVVYTVLMQPVRKDVISGSYRKIVEACMLSVLSISVIVAFFVLFRSIQLSRANTTVESIQSLGWQGRKLQRERAESAEQHYAGNSSPVSSGSRDDRAILRDCPSVRLLPRTPTFRSLDPPPLAPAQPAMRLQRQLTPHKDVRLSRANEKRSSPKRGRPGLRRREKEAKSAFESATVQRRAVVRSTQSAHMSFRRFVLHVLPCPQIGLDGGQRSSAEDSESSLGVTRFGRMSGIGCALSGARRASAWARRSVTSGEAEREQAQCAWSKTQSASELPGEEEADRRTNLSAWLSSRGSASPNRRFSLTGNAAAVAADAAMAEDDTTPHGRWRRRFSTEPGATLNVDRKSFKASASRRAPQGARLATIRL